MRRELGEWCRDEDVAWPHGCCSDKGPVVLTWWHAAFCCKCEEAVARRDAWQAEVIAAEEDMRGQAKHGETDHRQRARLQQLLEEGSRWVLGSTHPEWDYDDLVHVRSFLGMLVDASVGSAKLLSKASAARSAAQLVETKAASRCFGRLMRAREDSTVVRARRRNAGGRCTA